MSVVRYLRLYIIVTTIAGTSLQSTLGQIPPFSPLKFLTHPHHHHPVVPSAATATDHSSIDSPNLATTKEPPNKKHHTNAQELYFEQRIDHFGPSPGTYPQRYFLNDDYYYNNSNSTTTTNGGPLFFYLGNEADVTLYVNATGLLWENAPAFGALIVFAEHRYYGKSQIVPDDPLSNLQYLSADQALMDYVTLIHYLKGVYGFTEYDAVIGFGGSYGGMLASWGRLKYPHVWDGVIAASAPILPFEGNEDYFHPNFFAEGVTYDISTTAGASPNCETNLRKAFASKALITTPPSLIRRTFQLCDDDNTTDADLGWDATNWLDDALSYMAMGNYPYPSDYILNGAGVLPAFPVRVACEYLAVDMTGGEEMLEDWLVGLASFAGVYYNYSDALECNRMSAPVNEESKIVETLWDYQYCSQIFMVRGKGPDKYDIYWNDPWDGDAAARRCIDAYGTDPDRTHFSLAYGTPNDWARDASNIVWSQGEYDPWRGGGVTENLNDSLLAVVIEEAAHHLDLFFSHENDTEAVIAARDLEVKEMWRWVEEKRVGKVDGGRNGNEGVAQK